MSELPGGDLAVSNVPMCSTEVLPRVPKPEAYGVLYGENTCVR